MTAKRKISQRELWLVALVPTALVLILSQALPDVNDKIAAAERRLEQLGSTEARVRWSTELGALQTRLEESRQALEALAAQKVEVQARFDAFQAPAPGRAQSMAQALDTLLLRLADHGLQVLDAGGSAEVAPRDWRIGVAATWPAMLAALEDPETAVPGLALSALSMAPAQPSLPLRRWTLIVNGQGAGP